MSLFNLSIGGSTTPAGAMLPVAGGAAVLLIGGILAGPGTSPLGAMQPNAAASAVPVRPSPRAVSERAPQVSTASAIGELRRLSGLTWDQLARLFGTSRRSLHFWASGKPMNASNQEQLQRALAVLHEIDRGTAAANRFALLDGGETGDVPLDLLASGDFDGVRERLGVGSGRRTARPSPSREEMARRAPRPPAELVGALHDRVHPSSGRRLSLESLRTGRKG